MERRASSTALSQVLVWSLPGAQLQALTGSSAS